MRYLSWLTTATEVGKDINDILNNGYKNEAEGVHDSFGEVREAVTTISKSTIHLVISAGFAIVAMALLLVALKLGSANPAQRNEAKTRLKYILMGAGGLLLLSAIIIFISDLANKVITF